MNLYLALVHIDVLMVSLISVSAVSENNVIGVGDELPWHLPEDLAHFQSTIRNRPVVVGRNTHKNLPELIHRLPSHTHVLTTQEEYAQENSSVSIHSSVEELVTQLESKYSESQSVYVIGGGMVYESLFEYTDELIISEVRGEVSAEESEEIVYFPDIDMENWTRTPVMFTDEFTVSYYERVDTLGEYFLDS